jgi:hypothetical protein
MNVRVRWCAAVLLAAAMPTRPSSADPLSPTAFASLGTLNITSAGTYSIDTSAAIPLLTVGGTSYKGVLFNQGTTFNPELAVFTFDNINLAGGVTLRGAGDRPLVLLSKNNITLSANSVIDVSSASARGSGGAAPDTGPGKSSSNQSGSGFGGTGGGTAGGPTYGDLFQSLQAGSGGRSGGAVAGRYGGGAVELGAANMLTLASSASILADGGAGIASSNGTLGFGAGSGGGILLHAANVSLSPSASLAVRGGAGGNANTSAGSGGGGGRIAFDFDALSITPSVTWPSPSALTAGGAAGAAVFPGNPGHPGTLDARFGTLTVQSGAILTPPPASYTSATWQTLRVRSGGAATWNRSIAHSGILVVENNATFTAAATAPITNTGSIELQGGVLVAGGGISLSGAGTLYGSGTVVGPLSGAAAASLVEVPAGSLTVGSATRPDSVDYQGQFNVGNITANSEGVLIITVGRLILLDSDRADVRGVMRIYPGSSAAAPNGITLHPDAQIQAVEGPARLDGPLTNNGLITGPAAAGQFLTFSDPVDGAGSFNGNVRFTESYAPGNSPAQVSFGNLSLQDTATLQIELGGTTAGTQHDKLAVSGEAALGGTLSVSLLNDYTPAPLDSFAILTAASRSGSFSRYQGLDLPGPLVLAPVYSASGLTLVATLPGDANADGAVNFSDLVALAQNYNHGGRNSWSEGDFTFDGEVNFNDLVLMAQHYNQSLSGPQLSSLDPAFAADLERAFDQLPEPALALPLGVAFVLGRRRRGLSVPKPKPPAVAGS